MDLGLEFQKTIVGTKINILKKLSANFREKRTTLNFSIQICPKRNLGLEI